MSTNTTTKMAAFFLLFVATTVKASSSVRFLPFPAFCSPFESKSVGGRRALVALSSPHEQHQLTRMLSVRGGAKDDEGEEEAEEGEVDAEGEDAEEEEEDTEEEDEDETDVDSSEEDDDDEYYDDETEEEQEQDSLSTQLKKKSGKADDKKDKSSGDFVKPYFVSPSLQMYTTFGTILLSRKIDMFNPTVVRLVRTLFILYLLVQQAFIFYVRIMAKKNNDRTPIQVQNPLSTMLSSRLEKQQAGANDMVKNLASSFLKTESTVAEYDMGQAKSMQGGILFNIALMWVMHFKMQQVQPLLVTSINGFLQLAYNPLFQVYVLGRNLERPFKSPMPLNIPTAEDAAAEEAKLTEEGIQKSMDEASAEAMAEAAEDSESDQEEDESSDDEDEDSDDEDEDSDEEEKEEEDDDDSE